MLGPKSRSGLAFRLTYLHSSDVHLRQLWRLFFLQPQKQNRFRQHHLLASAVIHKKHSVPRRSSWLFRNGPIREFSSYRLAHIPKRERIFQQPGEFLHLLRREFRLRRVVRRRIQHPRRQRRPHRCKSRIIPQRQQRGGVSRFRARHTLPNHVDQRARRHLRRLQRSLRARRVRRGQAEQRRNRQ